MGKKIKTPVNANVWVDGGRIVGFSFSDGYRYIGNDAAEKFRDHKVEMAGTLTAHEIKKK